MNSWLGRVALCGLLAWWLPITVVSAALREEAVYGHWRVVDMVRNGETVPMPPQVQIVLELHDKAHRFRLAVRTSDGMHDERGTWSLRGETLTTTTSQGKVEQMTVRLLDAVTLELTKASEQLRLRKF